MVSQRLRVHGDDDGGAVRDVGPAVRVGRAPRRDARGAGPLTPPAPALVEDTILRLARERGAGRTIGPMDVARTLGGDHPDGWGPLMPHVRRAAVALMKQRRIVI